MEGMTWYGVVFCVVSIIGVAPLRHSRGGA
jgi:hypothetical protein